MSKHWMTLNGYQKKEEKNVKNNIVLVSGGSFKWSKCTSLTKRLKNLENRIGIV